MFPPCFPLDDWRTQRDSYNNYAVWQMWLCSVRAAWRFKTLILQSHVSPTPAVKAPFKRTVQIMSSLARVSRAPMQFNKRGCKRII